MFILYSYSKLNMSVPIDLITNLQLKNIIRSKGQKPPTNLKRELYKYNTLTISSQGNEMIII